MWTNFNHYNPNIFQTGRMSKRKMQVYGFDDTDSKPSKILVTEELMANQLSGLHLSSNFTSHGAQQLPEAATPSTSGTSQTLLDSSALPKLTICDEIRALKDSLTILPKVLQPERPTSALILWQPPAGDLGRYLREQMDKQKDEDAEKKEQACEATADEEAKDAAGKSNSAQVASNMEVELENNNTEMSCAYSSFSRAI